MTEKPILFQSDMIRAILNGTKTQTRRVLPSLPKIVHGLVQGSNGVEAITEQLFRNHSHYVAARYNVGDTLWVRETYCTETPNGEYDLPEPTDRPFRYVEYGDGEQIEVPHYRATEPEPHIVPWRVLEAIEEDDRTRWKPSIFMPRWASRITLEVTCVRCERLQDISEEDAKAEGVTMPDNIPEPPEWWSYRQEFGYLWNRINEKRGYGWESNCWVWVYDFKRIKPMEAIPHV